MKKILFITLAAIGLSFLASSCVKEKGFEDRVTDIVNAQLSTLTVKVDSLAKVQTGLAADVKTIKGNVDDLSKKCSDLSNSIGVVKDALAAEFEWTVNQLDTVGMRIDSIADVQKNFMREVDIRLGRLESRIQKIDVVPQYSDGSVYVGNTDTVVNFIIRPDSIAQKLVKAHPTGDSTFTFLAVKTISKSAANADADTVHLDIKGVSYENGIVSIKVNGSRLDPLYFEGKQSYNARLKIADGNSDNTSGFFPLKYKQAVEDLTPDVFYNWTSATPPTDTVIKVECAYEIGVSTGLPYGDGNVYYLNFANLGDYDYFEVTATDGVPRLLFNRTVDQGDISVELPKDATSGYWEIIDNPDGSKTYKVDLSKIMAKDGFIHLHAIKGANWANVTVTSMKLIK